MDKSGRREQHGGLAEQRLDDVRDLRVKRDLGQPVLRTRLRRLVQPQQPPRA